MYKFFLFMSAGDFAIALDVVTREGYVKACKVKFDSVDGIEKNEFQSLEACTQCWFGM